MARRKPQHGDYGRYTAGCRCTACTAACSRYVKRRLLLIERGEWQPWQDAAPVREHLLRLRAAGMSWKAIAEQTGVGTPNLVRATRPDRVRVRAAFARKVLAARITTDDLPDRRRVDSTGTRRRLQALIYAGWSVQHVAECAGLGRATVFEVLRRPKVQASTARAIRGAFEQLARQLPPEATRYERVTAARSRRNAIERGWVPAMAWDDIDDPDEKPKGVRREAS
ncbi:hypothetical protein ACQEUU_37085 [Nonomuraea sp. CA-218870]|uniref:hypothetical protein n=1 Tax=Nonomuraea sp. CA-218870 TaxID=3239998 RepID=UPI003D9240AB